MKTLFNLTYYSLNAFVVLGFLWLGYASQHGEAHAKPLTMAQLIERSNAEERAHKAQAVIDTFETADNSTDHYVMPKAPRNKTENDALFCAGVGKEVCLSR